MKKNETKEEHSKRRIRYFIFQLSQILRQFKIRVIEIIIANNTENKLFLKRETAIKLVKNLFSTLKSNLNGFINYIKSLE